jgi:hypothetical protein
MIFRICQRGMVRVGLHTRCACAMHVCRCCVSRAGKKFFGEQSKWVFQFLHKKILSTVWYGMSQTSFEYWVVTEALVILGDIFRKS